MGKRNKVGDRLNFYVGDWLNFYPGFHKINIRFGPASYFDNRFYVAFSLGWGQFYIHIPFIRSKYNQYDPPEYGFYFYSDGSWFPDSFWVCLGKKRKCFDLPWSMDWVRTSVLRADGSWEHETRGDKKDFFEDRWNDILWKDSYPYVYKKKDGEIQNRVATVRVEEREWRPLWFKWTKLFREVRRTIDISFDKEIGEKVGSWKGGIIGCDWKILPGETALEALRRMEKERKF